MDHPFLDTTKLTDDQLMDRIQKCHKILSGEVSMGHTTVVQSARAALDTYQFEWNERMRGRMLEDKFKPDEEPEILEFGIVDEYYSLDDDDKEED